MVGLSQYMAAGVGGQGPGVGGAVNRLFFIFMRPANKCLVSSARCLLRYGSDRNRVETNVIWSSTSAKPGNMA